MESLFGLLIICFLIWRIYRKISTKWKMESLISKQYKEMKNKEKNKNDFRL